MRKFERIRVEKGQGYIRDTGISVSEIIEESHKAESVQEILDIHPSLETDDILQALTYSLSRFSEDVSYWATDGLTPLTAVKGFSELLLDKTTVPSEQFTDEMSKRFLEIILDNAQRSAVAWRNLRTWILFAYEMRPIQREIQNLSMLIESIQLALPRNEPTATLEITSEVTTGDVSVLNNGYLAMAIVNLITDWEEVLSSKAKLTIKQTDQGQVRFQIFRPYAHCGGTHFDVEFRLETSFAFGPIALSALIVKRHESEIQISTLDDGLIFEFSLPVWKEND